MDAVIVDSARAIMRDMFLDDTADVVTWEEVDDGVGGTTQGAKLVLGSYSCSIQPYSPGEELIEGAELTSKSYWMISFPHDTVVPQTAQIEASNGFNYEVISNGMGQTDAFLLNVLTRKLEPIN